jgi:hypothetical protein
MRIVQVSSDPCHPGLVNTLHLIDAGGFDLYQNRGPSTLRQWWKTLSLDAGRGRGLPGKQGRLPRGRRHARFGEGKLAKKGRMVFTSRSNLVAFGRTEGD